MGIVAALENLFGRRRGVTRIVTPRNAGRVGSLLPTMEVRGGQQSCPPYAVQGIHTARRTAKPLRVVHGNAGRLVISGRMADVCAELDRLAAMEARGMTAHA